MEEPEDDPYTSDFKSHVKDFVILEHEKKMPIRLIDTYTGLLIERYQVTALLQERDEYKQKLSEAILEASDIPNSDPERPPNAMGPSFQGLVAFIKEYLAFAMFSHRWRPREITIKDIRNPAYASGIYSIVHPPPDLTEKEKEDFISGARKLQEFCCTAAKCGYRWAWADTCCIDEEIFGERPESINSMFLWYRNSGLTIVYLNDVDDVEERGRLPPIPGDDKWLFDEQIRNPFEPSHHSKATSDNTTTLHKCYKKKEFRLNSIQPDTQVEFGILERHLEAKFPSIPESKALGIFKKVPEWLTRGWTLQETLAPKCLRFYSKGWTVLEEADDRETEEAESKIHIPSFKFRARLVDHRKGAIWRMALHRTTEIPEDDLIGFEPGTRDVRTRLRWATRRRTTKDEDLAYCLIGIFDVTLPPFHGERHRAFLRLQEEILKRTGDVTLFDWRGRCSPVNSLLAYGPSCFMEPNLPSKIFDDNSTASPFRIILDLVRLICGTAWGGIKAVVSELKDWIMKVMESPQPGYTLINGVMNVPLLEHQVEGCEYLKNTARNDLSHHYRLNADGLHPVTVILASPDPDLVNNPKQYYLCRVWNRRAQRVFNIFLELLQHVLQEALSELWSELTDNAVEPSDMKNEAGTVPGLDEQDTSEAKLRKEIVMKRNEVMEFFKDGFPVYLIRVVDEHRIRVSTVWRVVAEYSKFDFSMGVETRLVL